MVHAGVCVVLVGFRSYRIPHSHTRDRQVCTCNGCPAAREYSKGLGQAQGLSRGARVFVRRGQSYGPRPELVVRRGKSYVRRGQWMILW